VPGCNARKAKKNISASGSPKEGEKGGNRRGLNACPQETAHLPCPDYGERKTGSRQKKSGGVGGSNNLL